MHDSEQQTENGKRVLAFLPHYNEKEKIFRVLGQFTPGIVDEVVIVDDGSTDDSVELLHRFIEKGTSVKMTLIKHTVNRGVGAGIRSGIDYARANGYDIFVVMAGNGKDDPREIPKVLAPILEEDYDFVQGSRFLEGGAFDNLPFPRKCMIKGFTGMLRVMTGYKCTDGSNGFRAYKLSLFDDPKINIWQDWLDRYELETYIQYRVLTGKYRVKEVAVSKVYPKKVLGTRRHYSKIRPFVDWWKIMRPIFLLKLKMKK